MKDKLHALTEVFVSEIIVVLVAEMSAALEDGFARGAQKRTASREAAPRAAKRGRGAKRDPAALEALTSALEAAVRANSGGGIEQIGKAMGVPTKELALPMKKLIAAGKIRVTGRRRATKYFPGRGGASKPSAKKKPKPRSASKKKGSKKASKKASKKK